MGGARPSPSLAVSAALAAMIVAVLVRRYAALVVLFAVAGAFATGAALQGVAWRQTEQRLKEVFGSSTSREMELTARVLAAPERNRDGGRTLAVESIAGPGTPALRLRLEVVDVPIDDARRLDELRRGDAVSVWCRLRAPSGGPGTTRTDARRRLAAQRCDATARTKSSRLVKLEAKGQPSPGRMLDGWRVAARAALDRTIGAAGTARAVLGAMLLGDRLLLGEDVNVLLREAGLIHILSISGLHTALSVVLMLALLRRAGLGARGLLVSGVASLLAFSAIAGHGASVWRACACVGVGLLARALSRDVEALVSLALASALLVAAAPTLAFNLGFLLSVVATFGLVTLRPAAEEGQRAPSVLASLFSASCGAYLATAPLLATSFGRLAPAALVTNLAAAPLCAACLATGAATIVLGSFPIAGGLVAAAAKASVAALLATSRCASALPGGHLRVAPPTAALTCVYVVLLLMVLFGFDDARRSAKRAIRLLLALVTIALHLGPPPPGIGPSRVDVLDVGQGLAVVLRGSDGRFVLVDAGPSGGGRFDAGDRIVVPTLVAQGCRRLEVFALSHDHDDHTGGALAVLRDLDVGELWVGEGSQRDPLTRALTAYAISRGVAVRRMTRGADAFSGALHLAVLHPGTEDLGRSPNDRCLVLRVRTTTGASILLPGDLEAGGERAMLANAETPEAGALVAPHHGADGSSTAEFLARVDPRVVCVSAGTGNRFGHPGAGALSRYASIYARVLRTDRNGTITLEDDRGSWQVSIEQERRGDEGQDQDGAE